LTVRQKKALAALLRSPTKAAAAEATGVGVSTIRRWLKEDREFRTAYREALEELLEDASAQAKRNLSRALDVLAEIMVDESESAQARITAARSTLEYTLKLTDIVDIAARMDELENTLREIENR
jgi:transposase